MILVHVVLRRVWNLLPSMSHQVLQDRKESVLALTIFTGALSLQVSHLLVSHRTSAIECRQYCLTCPYLERSSGVIWHGEKYLTLFAGDEKVMVKSSSWEGVLCRLLGETSNRQYFKELNSPTSNCASIAQNLKICCKSYLKFIIVQVLIFPCLFPLNQYFPFWSCVHYRFCILPLLF